MIVQLLTEHNLEFLSLKGGCTGSYEAEPTLVKMLHCWKSHVAAQLRPYPVLSHSPVMPTLYIDTSTQGTRQQRVLEPNKKILCKQTSPKSRS